MIVEKLAEDILHKQYEYFDNLLSGLLYDDEKGKSDAEKVAILKSRGIFFISDKPSVYKLYIGNKCYYKFTIKQENSEDGIKMTIVPKKIIRI